MKHVIITGGAGFIGSHLCEAFLQRDYMVTAIDNFVTGRKSNLKRSLQHPNFDFIEWDISRPLPKSEIRFLERHGLSGVLHFACPASPVDFDKIPFVILEVDSIGTMNTVSIAAEYNARYILASTSEVYGDPLVHPQKESYFGNVSSTGPRACYDETKRFAEAYVSTATRLGVGPKMQKLNAAIARIFNTYGPRMRPDDGRIIPEFCTRALKGASIPVCGDGMQTRSFCFISDLVDGIVKLFESDLREPVNLGNPDERSVIEIAKIISEMARTSYLRAPQIEFTKPRPHDPQRRRPDISKAQKLLNWQPRVKLQEGLTMTMLYMQDLMSSEMPLHQKNIANRTAAKVVS